MWLNCFVDIEFSSIKTVTFHFVSQIPLEDVYMGGGMAQDVLHRIYTRIVSPRGAIPRFVGERNGRRIA